MRNHILSCGIEGFVDRELRIYFIFYLFFLCYPIFCPYFLSPFYSLFPIRETKEMHIHNQCIVVGFSQCWLNKYSSKCGLLLHS
jgi:hypothetical protein